MQKARHVSKIAEMAAAVAAMAGARLQAEHLAGSAGGGAVHRKGRRLGAGHLEGQQHVHLNAGKGEPCVHACMD